MAMYRAVRYECLHSLVRLRISICLTNFDVEQEHHGRSRRKMHYFEGKMVHAALCERCC